MHGSRYKTDCFHFNGFKPCAAHKENRTECESCDVYRPLDFRILIIKTGAAGDVVRTTPLLHRLKKLYPQAEITWVTHYPELLPSAVDHILRFSWENCMALMDQFFNIVINLDKSLPETTLAMRVQSGEIKGFVSDQNGKILPADKNALHKWSTGFNDTQMLANQRHYVEELFEICGWEFEGETYWINEKAPFSGPTLKGEKTLIGLNTGCGDRWPTRLWPIEHFIELSRLLQDDGFEVVLLGGPMEDLRNIEIAEKSGARYDGVKPLLEFTSLVAQCDLLVTSVTMALHLAIAFEKKIILMNNIFPTNEFHLYGLGKIIEPQLGCKYCFKSSFDSNCETTSCMGLISPSQIQSEIRRSFPLFGSLIS